MKDQRCRLSGKYVLQPLETGTYDNETYQVTAETAQPKRCTNGAAIQHEGCDEEGS